ncbi:MAG: GTPase domain-containing protein [Archangiaceae bacterium]|nr:GTPase domain-containing protein [Archangiaceae bacterium]
MAQVDKRRRTITIELLVAGPRSSGKSAVISYLCDVAEQNTGTRPQRRGKAERVRVPMGAVRGFELNVDFFTSDDAASADGVYFVADSRLTCAAANAKALAQLQPGPRVFLYNKSDLPDAQLSSEAELRAALNPNGAPDFRGVAATGPGVSRLAMQLIDLVLKQL